MLTNVLQLINSFAHIIKQIQLIKCTTELFFPVILHYKALFVSPHEIPVKRKGLK